MNTTLITEISAFLFGLAVTSVISALIFGAIAGFLYSRRYTTYEERFKSRLPVASCLGVIYTFMAKLSQRDIYGSYWQKLNGAGWMFFIVTCVVYCVIAYGLTKWLTRDKSYEFKSSKKYPVRRYTVEQIREERAREEEREKKNSYRLASRESTSADYAKGKDEGASSTSNANKLVVVDEKVFQYEDVLDNAMTDDQRIKATICYVMDNIHIKMPSFDDVIRPAYDLISVDMDWVDSSLFDICTAMFFSIVFASPLYKYYDYSNGRSLMEYFWETIPPVSKKFKRSLVTGCILENLQVLRDKDKSIPSQIDKKAIGALMNMLWDAYFEKCTSNSKSDLPYTITNETYMEYFKVLYETGELIWGLVFPGLGPEFRELIRKSSLSH